MRRERGAVAAEEKEVAVSSLSTVWWVVSSVRHRVWRVVE